MSATATEMPTRISGVDRPNDAIDTAVGWVERAARTVKGWFETGWNWFTRAVSWVKNKIVSAAHWVWDRGVEFKDWAWDKAKRFGRWSKQKTINGWNRGRRWTHNTIDWTWDSIKWTGNVIADSAVGTWNWTRPFRTWVTSPWRMFTAGLVAAGAALPTGLLLPAIITGVAVVSIIGWAWYQDDAKSVDPEVISRENYQELNEAQLMALQTRMTEVRDAGERFTDDGVKNKISEYAGRLYLLAQRTAGSTESVGQIVKVHRTNLEKRMGKREAARNYIWPECSRGIHEEDKVAQALIAEHEPINV